jgi:hypothetical protein
MPNVDSLTIAIFLKPGSRYGNPELRSTVRHRRPLLRLEGHFQDPMLRISRLMTCAHRYFPLLLRFRTAY